MAKVIFDTAVVQDSGNSGQIDPALFHQPHSTSIDGLLRIRGPNNP